MSFGQAVKFYYKNMIYTVSDVVGGKEYWGTTGFLLNTIFLLF